MKKDITLWLAENEMGARAEGSATDFTADSRRVTPGAVFAALGGARDDGRRYAAEAAAKGAVLVLSEAPIEGITIPVAVVPNLKHRLARLAATFFNHPTASLDVIGVTGTNGKTTTTHLIENILEAAGRRPGLIGTVAYRYAGKTIDAPNTTPDAITLQSLLADMRDAGCRSVAMEVSSHGLAEGRADETQFNAGVFTNLTRDHLDYHVDMESYYQAKEAFFTRLLPASPKSARAVVNVDDAFGERLAKSLKVSCWKVGARGAEFSFGSPNLHPGGFEATVESPFGSHKLHCRLPGLHNVYNAVEALAASLAVGVEPAVAERALADVPGVPGRLEHFEAGGVHVYVDYAHSEDALANVLTALRPFTTGRILTVFGCGGDRDRGKRPRMGRVAAEKSDAVIITSDNPRTEDPSAILAEIEPGVQAAGMRAYDGQSGYWIDADRRSAIRAAVGAAHSGDIVLVAGKGHEDYQIVGTVKAPFDDRREAVAALHELTRPA